jgi:hypothetical protein
MRTSLRRTLTTTATRAAVAVTAVALAGSGALVVPADASPTSDKSAGWLSRQLQGGLVVSEYKDQNGHWQQYTDHGLTLDVYYALGQLDTRAAKRAAILDALEPVMHDYVDAFGTRYAGAIGKLLTAVEAASRNPRTYGDEDLVAGLEALVVTSGDEAGRAKDDSDFGDSSNTFGQAYVATALAGASSSLADEATTFLLKQQCAAGYFRENMQSSDFTCDGGTGGQSAPSVDATATAALAAFALAFAGPQQTRPAAARAFRDAVSWLVSKQRANGSFVGNGTQNTNSTGLAASVLLAAGKTAKARAAARWIHHFQVTRRLVRATGYTSADLGAIAYDADAFKAGKRKGITRGARYEWRRATAQAAPALDLIG